jgi:hypothetical protein
MEQIPIRDAADPPDNVVPLQAGRIEPETEDDVEPDEELGDTAADVQHDEPEPRQAAPPAFGAVIEQSARIVAGFVSATSTAVTSTVRDLATTSEPADTDEEELAQPVPTGPNPLGLAAGAAVGLTMQVSEAAIHAATSLAHTAGPVLSWFASPAMVRRRLTDVGSRAEELNDRWSQERPASEEAATSFAKRLLPELTSAILDQLDLTQIAIDHLDIGKIVDSIDLDAIVKKVDLNAAIDGVDLVGIVGKVMSEIDLPELIRESTGAVTSETVRTVRMRSADADQLLARVVDRVLLRKRERGTSTPAPQEGRDEGTGS